MTDNDQRYTGVVKRWIDERGYGFIAPDNDPTRDIFIHARALRERSRDRVTMVVGARVEFSVDTDEEGRPRAVDVVVLDLAAGT